MDINKERLKNELILEQLEEIEKLIEEHEENTQYLRANILNSLLTYCKCEDINELFEKDEFQELISSYKEEES